MRKTMWALAPVWTMALPVAAIAASAPAPVPVAEMTLPQLQNEVTSQRRLIGNGLVISHRPAGCLSPESRQFDFWIGEWDVSPTKAKGAAQIAESSITLHDQGCTIIEYWRPFAGAHGHSINAWDSTDRKWHQTWVEADGTHTEYRGEMKDGVLTFDNLSAAQTTPPSSHRMNFKRIDADTVHQWGEKLDPAKGEWVIEWDFTYSRRPGTAPR